MCASLLPFLCDNENRTQDSYVTRELLCTPSQRCNVIVFNVQNALYLLQASSGDFTNVEMMTIERTLNNSCSQSLAGSGPPLQTEFVEIGNLRLRVIGPCMFRREIKIDAGKYTRPVLMGLCAVSSLEKKQDNQERALRLLVRRT